MIARDITADLGRCDVGSVSSFVALEFDYRALRWRRGFGHVANRFSSPYSKFRDGRSESNFVRFLTAFGMTVQDVIQFLANGRSVGAAREGMAISRLWFACRR